MKACIFDFDGVLVDSMPTYAACMLRILDENHIRYPEDIIKTITPLGVAGTVAHFQTLGLQMSREQILARIQQYLYEAYADHIQAKPGVIAALQQLHAQGIRLNILTAGPHVTLDPCVRRLGLTPLFENIWSCDDFQTGKTDPEIYRKAAGRLGLAPGQILFLDDNLHADRAAKAAGLKVWGVYDQSSAEYEAAIRESTDHYIYDLSALAAAFQEGTFL